MNLYLSTYKIWIVASYKCSKCFSTDGDPISVLSVRDATKFLYQKIVPIFAVKEILFQSLAHLMAIFSYTKEINQLTTL